MRASERKGAAAQARGYIIRVSILGGSLGTQKWPRGSSPMRVNGGESATSVRALCLLASSGPLGAPVPRPRESFFSLTLSFWPNLHRTRANKGRGAAPSDRNALEFCCRRVNGGNEWRSFPQVSSKDTRSSEFQLLFSSQLAARSGSETRAQKVADRNNNSADKSDAGRAENHNEHQYQYS